MSAALEGKELAKKVRAQIARRYIDSSLLNISVFGGSVHLVGAIRTLRTHPDIDMKAEMETISQILRTIPGVRDVVWDVSIRS
ncbi:MAG: BON domain-containing protein [Chloroherpetonaceae bacterium]|nr:BON domain-containing protein [Chloroherpetonaceae bacterium]